MQRTGADAPRPPTRLAFAAELLGVTSIERLAASLVRRTMLPGGRFEAHEFGQNAHSTASAATLIGGLSGIPELPDRLVRSPITSAAALVDSAGNIRGYDGNPTIGTTNWAMSQLLLGLTLRRTLAAPYHDQIGKLVCGLIARQHQSGGWPLRAGEDPTLTFSFYPQLALARAHALGTSRDEKVRRSLQLGLRYTRSALSSGGLSPVERILAIHVLDRLNRHAGTTTAVDRNQVLTQSFSEVGSLRLEDEPVISFRQPMWHTVMWRPLLYLCLREWASPMSPVNAFLGNELLLTFDHRTSAWLGPGQPSAEAQACPGRPHSHSGRWWPWRSTCRRRASRRTSSWRGFKRFPIATSSTTS